MCWVCRFIKHFLPPYFYAWISRASLYLTTHSAHFIYGYMVSDIWLWAILIVRKETRWRHIGYSFRLTARVLLHAPSHRQDSTYHSLCYTSRGALPGIRNSSMGPPHEGSIWRPITPWANTLTMEIHLAPAISRRTVKNSHGLRMFTDKHFWYRQYWHRIRFSFVILHFWFLWHTYLTFSCLQVRTKNFWK